FPAQPPARRSRPGTSAGAGSLLGLPAPDRGQRALLPARIGGEPIGPALAGPAPWPEVLSLPQLHGRARASYPHRGVPLALPGLGRSIQGRRARDPGSPARDTSRGAAASG